MTKHEIEPLSTLVSTPVCRNGWIDGARESEKQRTLHQEIDLHLHTSQAGEGEKTESDWSDKMITSWEKIDF
jgi:hypothetical protein